MVDIIPVEITVYADRSYTFVTKTLPAAELIKNDPDLVSPQNARIKRIIKEKFKDKIELMSV